MADSDLEMLVRFEDETLAGMSPLTVQRVQGALMRFSEWLGSRSLLGATTGDISTWTVDVASAKRAERISSLNRFYVWCLSRGVIDWDPSALLAHQRHPITGRELPELMRGWSIAIPSDAPHVVVIVSRM